MKKIAMITLPLLLIFSKQTFANLSTDIINIYPMVIRADNLPKNLLGLQKNNLSLMSMQQGKLKPIPFQIDSFDQSGLIYIPGISKNPLAGSPNQLSSDDEIVFMLKDAGAIAQQTPTKGRILYTIALPITNQETRYVYLVENNPLRSRIHYIQTQLKKGELQTPSLQLKFNPKNMADLQQARIRQGNDYSENLFGGMQLSASAGILSSLFNTHLDLKDNIEAIPIAVKEGPIRSTILLRTRVKWIGIPFYHNDFSINFYPYSIKFPSRFATNSLSTLSHFVFLIKNPKVDFSLNLKNLAQGRFYFDALKDPNLSCAVDNKNGIAEQKINSQGLPGNWIYFQKPNSQVLFSNRLPFLEDGILNQFLKGMNVKMNYQNMASDQVKFSLHLEGLPKLAMQLLPSASKLHISSESDIQTFMDALLAKKNTKQRLALEKIIKKALIELKQQGQANTPEDFAGLLIQDVNKIGFSGIDRNQVNELIHGTFAKISKIEDFSIEQSLNTAMALAQQSHIDLSKIRYRAIDNTVWFPTQALAPKQLVAMDTALQGMADINVIVNQSHPLLSTNAE